MNAPPGYEKKFLDFIRLRREIGLAKKLHTEILPGTTDEAAILDRPIVLAGEFGTNGMPRPYSTEQLKFVKVSDPVVPLLAGRPESVPSNIKPEDAPLVFRAQTANLGSPITLVPYYKIGNQRYTIYWNLGY